MISVLEKYNLRDIYIYNNTIRTSYLIEIIIKIRCSFPDIFVYYLNIFFLLTITFRTGPKTVLKCGRRLLCACRSVSPQTPRHTHKYASAYIFPINTPIYTKSNIFSTKTKYTSTVTCQNNTLSNRVPIIYRYLCLQND